MCCWRSSARRRALTVAERDAWLTFVVVGAGPTGVELAGTLAEIARHTLTGEFRNIDPARAHILLLEGGARVLPGYPPSLSKKAARQLRRLGVDVQLDTRVVDLGPTGAIVGNGATLAARRSSGPPVCKRLTLQGHFLRRVIGPAAWR